MLTKNKPIFSSQDNKDAHAEGWWISNCTLVSGDEEIQLQRIDEMEKFETDELAWKHVVEQAITGSELHLRAVKFMEYHNFSDIELLNMVFVERPTKDDIPKKCTSCNEAHVPSGTMFQGHFPTPEANNKWWKDKNSEWSMSIDYKRPHYYLDGVDYTKDIGTMKVSQVICPSCKERMEKYENEIIEEFLKD